jgi:hypothetical protein
MRKYFKLIVFYAASLVVFGFCLLLFFLALLISNSCDDAAGETARNSRGDIVKERLTICTGIGTVINHSVVLLPLKPSFVWKTITLAKYEPVSDSSPVFHWIDNDRLTIDLGKVHSVWSRVDMVGSIHITYAYTTVGTN